MKFSNRMHCTDFLFLHPKQHITHFSKFTSRSEFLNQDACNMIPNRHGEPVSTDLAWIMISTSKNCNQHWNRSQWSCSVLVAEIKFEKFGIYVCLWEHGVYCLENSKFENNSCQIDWGCLPDDCERKMIQPEVIIKNSRIRKLMQGEFIFTVYIQL